jgi:hypothetical protein
MRWKAEWTDEFEDRWDALSDSEKRQVVFSVEVLKEKGPNAGRPYVDSVKGSRYLNMKELRAARRSGSSSPLTRAGWRCF